jgi:hypothetical protein
MYMERFYKFMKDNVIINQAQKNRYSSRLSQLLSSSSLGKSIPEK